MPHHQSAKKRVRRNERRRVINKARVTKVRTSVKKFELALSDANVETAQSSFKEAVSQLQKGVQKGVLHQNTVSRKISRLNKKLKALVLGHKAA